MVNRRGRFAVFCAFVALTGCEEPELPFQGHATRPLVCLIGENETPPGPVGVTFAAADRPVNRDPDHRFVLRTTNRASEPAWVDLEVHALVGGRRTTHRTRFRLEPGSTSDTPVTFEDLAVDRSELTTSGSIRASAVARLESDPTRVLGTALSAERFFHVDELTDELVDYDGTMLVERFDRGDHIGRAPPRERPPGVERVTVLSVPRGSNTRGTP